MKEAAVIIPHYCDEDRLRRCLGGLAATGVRGKEAVEVVVVDNASPLDLSWIEQDFPFVQLIVEDKKGAAHARNRGIAETTAARLILLDSDCVPDPNWLEVALGLPLDGKDVIGGEVRTFDETPPPRSGSEAFETVFAFAQRDYIERKNFSVTANLITSRPLFQTVGALRDGFSEDLDWCHRAVEKGARLRFEPSLSVQHPTRQDWAALRKKWVRTTREAYVTQKDRKLSWVLRALLMPLSAIAHAPRILFSPKLAGWRERVRGLATLFRLRLARTGWMLKLVLGGNVT